MTNELNTKSTTRPKLSPEEAKNYFASSGGVELVQMITRLIEACEEHVDVIPVYKPSGTNIVFYYFHKKDEWKAKEKFNLLQIGNTGEVRGSRFLQIQCNHENVQLGKTIWVNHWNGLGRITGAGSLVSMPSPTVRDQHKFRTDAGDYPSLSSLLGKDSENLGEIASHLATTASNIKKALS